jgi:hypothetical protein
MLNLRLDDLFWSYEAKDSFVIMNVSPAHFILWRGISSFLSQHFMYKYESENEM